MPTNRSDLSSNLFYNGAKPDRNAFSEVFNSFLHLTQDGLTVETNNNNSYLAFENGIRIGDMPTALGSRGALRFNQATNTLEVHDGTAFQAVGSGQDDGGFSTIDGSESIAFNALGNVGIGTGEADAPRYRLEVELSPQEVPAGPNPEPDRNNQVRFGSAIISRGEDSFANDACFSHQNFALNRSFAIRHTSTGSLFLNSSGTSALLSQILFMTNGTQVRMIINREGRVGIGTTSPASDSMLQVNGNVRGTSFIETSDKRFKKDIKPLNDSLKKVLELNGVSYKNSNKAPGKDNTPDTIQLGMVAQEVEAILPEVVSSDGEGFKSLNYTRLVPVLVEAIKELHQQTDALKAQIEALKADV